MRTPVPEHPLVLYVRNRHGTSTAEPGTKSPCSCAPPPLGQETVEVSPKGEESTRRPENQAQALSVSVCSGRAHGNTARRLHAAGGCEQAGRGCVRDQSQSPTGRPQREEEREGGREGTDCGKQLTQTENGGALGSLLPALGDRD